MKQFGARMSRCGSQIANASRDANRMRQITWN